MSHEGERRGLRSPRRRSPLDVLAAHAGIVAEYVDQTGTERRRASDDTKRALLAAMGIDASSDAAARDALSALRSGRRRELLPTVRVVSHAEAAGGAVFTRVPAARVGAGRWQLELVREDGTREVRTGPRGGTRDTPLEVARWSGLPAGYHRLRLSVSTRRSEIVNEQTIIIAPPRCVVPADRLDGHDAFGIVANLYSVRSRDNWGVGDLSDLAALAEWAGANGADFVGVNPLHALLNRGSEISPYSPVSRLFRNPIYVDVLRVPELEAAPAVLEQVRSPEATTGIEALRASDMVKYEQVMAVKGVVLDALHRTFGERVRGTGCARDRAYAGYLSRAEPALTAFATWMAIAEECGSDWRKWPAALRDARSEAVRAFAEAHARRVDYHRWVQFELDRQLSEAAQRARGAGMRIGLYQDLAIGTSAAGADTWAFPELFVRGASIGAPPDPYASMGQNWGLPPIDPRSLARQGYRYFIDLVRSGFRHAGALRIDHVVGLFRLFWIPEGMPGSQGAYVRYPADDLLGIVALESVRHGALVVGEDLGTVPPVVPRVLGRWGILSSKVLHFERNRRGEFRAAKRYPKLALATANTHDMAPLAGFWDERDIDIRARVGMLETDAEVDRARRERAAERTALLRRLARERVLPHRAERGIRSLAELRTSVHAFLCRTPAALVGFSLDDLAGEIDPVNVPGVGPSRYPSWTRKMREPLEVIMLSDEADGALRCDGRRRGGTT